MADNTLTYTTRIFLNAEEAKKQLDELQSKVETLRKKKDEAARAGDWPTFNSLKKQLDQANNQIRSMHTSAQKIDRVLENLSTASVKEIQQSIRAINDELNSGAIERGSKDWNFLQGALRRCNQELKNIRGEHALTTSSWQKVFKFLNDSWGGILILFQSISGLSTTIRKSIEDYANMEEAMADVRKYTGLTDEGVRKLNEELKKMDTRTSREELNQLAGAAGRLGKTSKDDILEFVEAGNMIQVALGDDLGDGAIDKVGKLAMAFGEDDSLGLRGAMLATGSAINELAQNSSAQAGYLVDFTARVAGFGKQLGLTQPQIMGFGAVMDENLLRDEMAATAFGNMLTKMQTDTAKFAKIAGMGVEEFTRLLNDDANTAIIALAENLKKANPQNMMKMLDDMGLDGSRAVGVLSTLADKIDDVRERQELATKAYKEAKSVGDEYSKMNETVEAQIEKAKKKFHEVSVTLGEQLLPIVRYTISSGSLIVKGLSAIISTFVRFRTTIISTGLAIALLTAYRQKDVIWTKIQLLWNDKIIKGLKALRLALMDNPWTVVIVAIAAIGGAVYDLVKRTGDATKRMRELSAAEREQNAVADSMKAVNEEANRATAEEITKFKQLRKTLEDNTKTYGERKKALDEIKKMVPSYHGTLTTENTLINNNATALDNYVNSLMDAARAQAAFNQMVKIQESSIKHEQLLSDREGNRLYAKNQLTKLHATETSTIKLLSTNDRDAFRWELLDAEGKHVSYINKETKEQIERYQQLIRYNDKRIAQEKEVLGINLKQSEKLQEIVDKGKKDNETPADPVIPYKSDVDLKKEQEERLKKLKEADAAEKAITDGRMADNILSYQAGLKDYRTFLAEQKSIQEEGLKARMAVWKVGSVEYEKYRKQLAAMTLNGDREQTQLSLQELERRHQQERALIKAQFYDEKKETYQNEDAINQALIESDLNYLMAKKEKFREGSLERMQVEWEIQDLENNHKLENEQQYIQRLAKYREEAGRLNYQQLQEIELNGVKAMYGALLSAGKMTKEEYDAIIEHIKRKYAELEAGQAADNNVRSRASKALDTATKKAGVEDIDAGNDAATGIFSIKSALENQKSINEQLKILYGKDYENNKEYQEAKRQLNQQTMQSIVAGAQAAYQSISTMMSAASSLAQANSDLEVARITANYDKQIEAAGKNSKKRERLEKERDEKIAKAKTKANKKAMAMEIAQAIAQTAMGAINAYTTTLAGAPWPANLVLAPISAGIALAAGAVQIATIKKQHQAEALGYYEGGFTGGRRYRREAGVVHEGEFVANHQAVANPAVLPFLNFLDQAQRNNTVGSLTMQDVSRAMGGGQSAVVAPVVNVQTDNSELQGTLSETHNVLDRLTTQLEQGIGVDIPIDGENGMYRRLKRYENLLKNK